MDAIKKVVDTVTGHNNNAPVGYAQPVGYSQPMGYSQPVMARHVGLKDKVVGAVEQATHVDLSGDRHIGAPAHVHHGIKDRVHNAVEGATHMDLNGDNRIGGQGTIRR